MQGGFRGYLLTNQESFLQPYYKGLSSVPALIKEQAPLLTTDFEKETLDSIGLLHKDWVEYADSLISAKKDTLPESGRRYKRLFEKKLKMEVGKKLNNKIHSLFDSLDDYEYRLRQERRSTLQKSIKSTRNTSLMLTVISILFAVISCIYIIRTITKRISKMVNLAEKIS